MTAPEPLVVAGGTVAALVAADAAAATGRDVVLLLPRKNVGGGFTPLHYEGHRLDRGLRALELSYEGVGVPPPLAAYDAAGAGHRPYARLIEAYVRGLAGDVLVELDRPRQWLNGNLGDELLTTCDLTGLAAQLTPAQRAAVAAETADAARAGAFPAPEALRATSTTDASRALHGDTFHDLVIAPLAAKLRAEGADDVPADLRRKLWLALFRPRTLHEAATGAPIGFRPERPFHTLTGEGTGALVTRLVARLEADPRVTVRRVDGISAVAPAGRGGREVAIIPAGDAPLQATDPILALAPGELFGAAGVEYAPDRVTTTLAWVRVAEDDVIALPSFLHVVDSDVPVFRLSRGERRDGRVIACAELAHHVGKDAAAATAEAALRTMGLIGEGAAVEHVAAFSGPTFTAPTFANRERFAAARAAYDARGLRAVAIGGSEAFGADSLNEQLVQGLRAAEPAAPRSGRAAA